MSVTLDLNGITTVRSGIPSTYILSIHSLGSSAVAYKIGRTKNPPSRIGSLLAAFNSGSPKGTQPFPSDLVHVCFYDMEEDGTCPLGDDCFDHQYEVVLLAHIEGDIEGELHRRFSHLRIGRDFLHNSASRSEWFEQCWEGDEDYAGSIDEWLTAKEVAA